MEGQRRRKAHSAGRQQTGIGDRCGRAFADDRKARTLQVDFLGPSGALAALAA
jgi:hypothetical protein